MSATPHEALAEALTVRCETDAFVALVPSRIVNDLPENPAYPAVRLVVRGRPVGPIGGATQWECEAEFDIYADYAGDQVCLRIADVLVQAIEASGRLAATGWNVIVMLVADLYEVQDELINDRKVKRWTLPVTLKVVKATS